MDNQYGLDADYFIKLVRREFSPDVIRNQRPEDLARSFARAARTACAGVLREDEFNWEHLRSTGQIKPGDKLRFTVSGETATARVKDVLNPGTDAEEVIYNLKKNYFFITKMALAGSSTHKSVQVRIRRLPQ